MLLRVTTSWAWTLTPPLHALSKVGAAHTPTVALDPTVSGGLSILCLKAADMGFVSLLRVSLWRRNRSRGSACRGRGEEEAAGGRGAADETGTICKGQPSGTAAP